MDKQTTKSEFAELLKFRTKKLAVEVILLCQKLPKTEEARIIKNQLIRSATSTAANYRASCRARSAAEFYAKISIVIEEADETLFWFELLEVTSILPSAILQNLKKEAIEILSIMAKARKNTHR